MKLVFAMKLVFESARGVLSAMLFVICAPVSFAGEYSDVVVNGERLTVEQVTELQEQFGTLLAPGQYAMDDEGCWIHLSTVATGCLGRGYYGDGEMGDDRYGPFADDGSGEVVGDDGSGVYITGDGSGEITNDGSWNVYSDQAEMGVGGTSDGCIYTTEGWSNC